MAEDREVVPDDGMDPMEEACFGIISTVGAAKSSFIEAIKLAKQGDFDEARTLVRKGNDMFLQGHETHMSLLQEDAATMGNIKLSLLLVHSEDQLMQAETFRILADEFIDLYQRLG